MQLEIRPEGLYQLTKKDVRKASCTLAEAFLEYPFFASAINGANRMEALLRMFEVDIRYALKKGAAYSLDQEMNEVSTWLFNQNRGQDLMGYLTCVTPRTLELFRLVGRKGLKTLERAFKEVEAQMLKQKFPQNTVYLSSIGVRKEARGQHRATRLILPVLNALEEKGHSVFLYTNEQRNVAIYERFGFRTVYELQHTAIPCRTFFMLKTV